MASAEHSRYDGSILGEEGEVGGAEQHTPEQPASPAREPLVEEPAVVKGPTIEECSPRAAAPRHPCTMP